MSEPPDHLLEPLEDDETVPPRPEEQAADVARGGTAPVTPPPGREPGPAGSPAGG